MSPTVRIPLKTQAIPLPDRQKSLTAPFFLFSGESSICAAISFKIAIETRFQQVRGVAVPQRMHMGPLVAPALLAGAVESTLHTAARDGTTIMGQTVRQPVTRRRRKQPQRRAMRAPVSAQQFQRRLGQGHIAVLLAFTVDVQEQPRTVHIRHLQPGAFQQAQATGVDRCQTCPIDRNLHCRKCQPYLFPAQHHGQLPLPGWAHKAQRGPLLLQRLLVKELDATERDGGRGPGYLEKVLAQVFIAELVRAAVVMLG
jgi:hypothetical protein